VLRAAYFALVGVLFLLHWLLSDPSFEETETMTEWPYVLGFSAALVALALALPIFGRLVGGRRVFRVALVPAAGAALSSVANIVEDGLGMSWAFWGFVLGTAMVVFGLVALTIVILRAGRGRDRLPAFIPAATMAGILLYVVAGGLLMPVAWLAAAAVALARPTPATAPVAPTTP
jgi:hypothetical protein